MRFFSPLLVWTGVALATRTASVIRSTQRGVITSSAASDYADITAVVDGKVLLTNPGVECAVNSFVNNARLVMTSTTRVTRVKGDAVSTTTQAYHVTEFY